jgi:hypothetical protein
MRVSTRYRETWSSRPDDDQFKIEEFDS